MADDRKEPQRQTVRLDRLKPPPRHRQQPPDNPHEQRFNAIHGRNERAKLCDKYRKKYKGKHRKEGES